jgi:hypothetical protein
MKKSELKEIIRTSLLEEMEDYLPSTYTDKDLDDLLSIVLKYVEDPNDAEEEIAKFDAGGFDAMSSSLTANLLRDKDYNDWYNKLHSIKEEEEEEVEVEDEVEVTADEKEGIDVKQDAESDLTGVVGDVQDNLEAALEAARKLGDEKLVDQIGNTLTFFTRTHVVKENIEIPGATLTKANQAVKDVATMAQVMVDLYQQIQDKEQINFTKNPEFSLALNKLKELIKTGSEEEPVKEEAQIDVDVDSPAEDAEIGMKLDESEIEIPDVEQLYQDHEIEWIDKPFDYFGDGNVIKKGDKGRIIAPEVPKKGYYLIGMVGSKGKEVKFYSFLNKSFKLDEPLRDPTNESVDKDAEIGIKLDESIIRMKKLAGLIK